MQHTGYSSRLAISGKPDGATLLQGIASLSLSVVGTSIRLERYIKSQSSVYLGRTGSQGSVARDFAFLTRHEIMLV